MFKDITDADIAQVQEAARDELPALLNANLVENNIVYDNKQKSCFFGIFAADPTKFQFLMGEIKLIKALSKGVRLIIDDPVENSNLDVFSMRNGIKKKNKCSQMWSSVFGTVYGDMRASGKLEDADKASQLHNKLFMTAQKQLKKHESKTLQPKRVFEKESVKVTTNSNGTATATIACIFCNEESFPVKVWCGSIDSASWSLSNLITHIQRHHQKPKRVNHTLKNIVTELKIEPVNKADARQKQSKESNDETESQNNDLTQGYEDILFDQLSAQVIRMMNTSEQAGEVECTYVLGAGSSSTEKSRTMKYCRAAADGNCLFSSLCHQIFFSKLTSPEHKKNVNELRAAVVQHISAHFEQFEHELRGRVFEKKNGPIDVHMECRRFLTQCLPTDGYWGGSETLKAVSELHNVNIVIITDDGKTHLPCKFSADRQRSVIVFYHGTNEKNNSENIHYDSVIELSMAQISTISKQLIAAYTTQNLVKNLSNSCISINSDS